VIEVVLDMFFVALTIKEPTSTTWTERVLVRLRSAVTDPIEVIEDCLSLMIEKATDRFEDAPTEQDLEISLAVPEDVCKLDWPTMLADLLLMVL